METIRRGVDATFIRAVEAGESAQDTLTYRLGGAGKLHTEVATIDGSAWKATIPGSATGKFPPGDYEYEGVLESADGRINVVDSGRVKVVRSLVADNTRQVELTFAEQALEKVEALLLEASDSSELSLSVQGESFSFESRADLLAYRQRLRNIVEQERVSRELGITGDQRNIQVRLPGRGGPRRRRGIL